MRVEWNDGTLNVWFRQSWLNTYLQVCQEQSRLKLVDPDADTTTWEAVLGTCTHAGIEHNLRGCDDYIECVAHARRELALISENETIRDDPEGKDYRWAYDQIPGLIAAWWKTFRNRVHDEGVLAVEHKFEVVFDEFDVGHVHVVVNLEGMIDCITRRRVWDWKTAGQQYKGWEKQRWAIQPTAYCAAVDADPQFPLSYPMTFSYGIMLKGGKEPTQTVDVQRLPEHNAWLRQQLRQIISDRALETNERDFVNPLRKWQLTDSHVLCSPKWCPWYDKCKGVYIPDNILRNVA